MSFRLALSNSVLADLDWVGQAQRAREWGYEGLVISAPHGSGDLLLESEREAAAAGAALREAGLAAAALEAGSGLYSPSQAARSGARDRIRRLLVVAAAVGARYLLVRGGGPGDPSAKGRAVEHTVDTLCEVAPDAARMCVELVFENGGLLGSSADAWFISDAVGPPLARVSLDVLAALEAGDTPSIAVPRLSRSLVLVRLADFAFDGESRPQPILERAGARLDIPLLIDLLKGIAFQGWLYVAWPRAADGRQPAYEEALPAIAALLTAERERKTVELSAYKGDRTAPRFARSRAGGQNRP